MVDRDTKNVPVFSGGLHNTAQIKIWQEILKTETEQARHWDDKWGFFKAPERKLRSERRREAGRSQSSPLAKSASTPALATAGREVVQPTRSGDDRAPAGIDYLNDRQKVLDQRSRMVPKQRFERPVTTSHQLGWNRTLELFGVSQHGITRDHGIQPSY
mmetsp:Transcript_12458/g.25860  ORF Transcript_12458/g.25860 Transcript_12458/m.25860 type:complete len:159 (-) Transcript_12458:171-647(-)